MPEPKMIGADMIGTGVIGPNMRVTNMMVNYMMECCCDIRMLRRHGAPADFSCQLMAVHIC